VQISNGAAGGPGTSPVSGAPALPVQQRLRVEPRSIVGAKKAFQDALDGVHTQLRRIRSAAAQPWAADPVSVETAQAFNNRTSGDDHNAAEHVLTEYAGQLSRVIDSLQQAEDAYRRAEGENTAMWGRQTA
jgi:hypothetical protein